LIFLTSILIKGCFPYQPASFSRNPFRFLSRFRPAALQATSLKNDYLIARNLSTKMSKKNLTVCGWVGCGAYQQAKSALLGLQAVYPQDFKIEVKECKLIKEY
jgi:hypothetical protein